MSFYFINKFRLIFYIFVITLNIFEIKADEKPDSTKTYKIGEITVTEQYRNSEIRSSATLQILSAKQIENLNALQISDAVKYFSGISVKDYGGIGGLKTVSVRSLGAGHTAISYDGIVLSDCQTGQIDIGRFSLENVDMLTLVNGQSDNIFQSARLFASASVLNIKTLIPQFNDNESLKGKLSIKAGSFGLVNPAFAFNKKINRKLSFSLSGEWLSANGEYPYELDYSYLNDGIKTSEIRKNTDVKNLRLETALYAQFSKYGSGYVKSYLFNSERGLPGATILYNDKAFLSQRLNDNTFLVQAHYQKDFSKLLSIQFNGKYNNGYIHYLDTAVLNNSGFESSIYKQNEYYSSISILLRAFNNLSFAFSTDGFINNMHADFENPDLTNEFAKPVRYSLLSVMAAKYVTEKILATTSILSTLVYDKVNMSHVINNQQKLSPYLSFSYKLFDDHDLRLRTFYKNIFRMPSFNDLYYTRIGNRDLRPEITNQFDFGITYSTTPNSWIPFFSITLDAYRNTIKDKIIAMPTKNIFVWSMLNLGKVEIQGFDLTAESTFAVSKKVNLLLGTTYTYQRALDITDPASSTYNHQIAYTPRISGSGKAAIETPWVNVAYSVIWSGKRYALFQNYPENRLQGFADHSISLSHDYELYEKLLSLKFEMLNLLNENYSIIKWFPMPGRSVRASISLRFNK